MASERVPLWRRLLRRLRRGSAPASATVGGRSPRQRRSLEQRAREAASDFLGGAGIDGDEHLYRSASEGPRDLPSYVHERQIRLAYAAYTTTPIGRRAIDLTTDYVVGDGLRWEVAESEDEGEPTVEEVAEVLERHWSDPQNGWEHKLRSRVTALGLWGEVAWPTFVDFLTGHVRLGHLDPQRIAQVEYDPDNCERPLAVHLRRTYTEGEDAGRSYRIVELQEEGEHVGYLQGEILYGAVNQVPGATRGHSDLLHVLDWIDSHDELLFNAVEAARLRSAPSWDVTIRGATREEIQRRSGTIQPPRPGGAIVHNEAETWAPCAVDLGAAQHDQFSRMIRVHILGALGIPEHWFGEGDSATRATAAEMSAPVIRRLKARQVYVVHLVRQVLRYVVDQAILAGALRGTPRTKDRITVEAAPLERRDLTAAGAVVAQVTTATQLAEQAKWITRDTGRRIFAAAVDALGVQIDLEAEAEQIDADEEAGADDERGELEAANLALRDLLERGEAEGASEDADEAPGSARAA